MTDPADQHDLGLPTSGPRLPDCETAGSAGPFRTGTIRAGAGAPAAAVALVATRIG